MLAFYDEHGLDQQRAYAIVCLMVGSNSDQFKELAHWVQMPEARQDTCLGDYSNAKYSRNLVLKPFLRAPDQPKSTIDVAYEPVTGNLDTCRPSGSWRRSPRTPRPAISCPIRSR